MKQKDFEKLCLDDKVIAKKRVARVTNIDRFPGKLVEIQYDTGRKVWKNFRELREV